VISLLLVLAQAEPSAGSEDLTGYLLQYGIPGVVILAMLGGLLWAKPAVDRLIRDKEKAETQRDDLLRVYEQKMLPALTDSIVITRDLKPVIQEVTTVLSKVKDELDKRQR
jgi:hypothetical protein